MSDISTPNTVLKYRPDIDGLRCVAVLSVLAFHVSSNRLPGGFVGVDVFFVISGYLISAIVFSEIAASRFSVIGFYERRVRRIFPALFATLIAVSVVLSVLLLPAEYITYAKSVLAATTSCSNFFFWQHSGYFDSPTSNPLLHTWSLAVEEQFYILFPIFLVIIRHFFPQRLKLAVLILFFASLVASEITLLYSPTTAFYMPYTRAWELLLGTIVSLGFFPRLRGSLQRNATTVVGIAMIGYSALKFNAETPFPGLPALVPCIGSAFIIGAGESGSSLVGRALSWRPVVFIGLISYSLYLWHWPIIVLNDLGFSVNLTGIVPDKWALLLLSQGARKMLEILVSFVLATLSWKFVERPFRSSPRRVQRRPLFTISAAVMIFLMLFSSAVIFARGFPKRFPPRAVQVASYLQPSVGPNADRSAVDHRTVNASTKDASATAPSSADAPPADTTSLGRLGDCGIVATNQETVFDDNQCFQMSPGKETYLLFGDSTAGTLWGGLKSTIPGANVELAAVWGCEPSIHPRGTPLCQRFTNFIFQKYLPSHPIQALLVEARWYRQNLDALAEIVSWSKAHGIRLVVFGPVAEYDAPLPRLLAYSIAWKNPNLVRQHRVGYSAVLDEEMRDLAENSWHVCYASIYKATCGGDRCIEYADEKNGIPLMRDEVHLSGEGSELLARRMLRLGSLGCLDDKSSAKAQASTESSQMLR
jgi:peptidoglycan/LPS O-acetylase OafA/YrhL